MKFDPKSTSTAAFVSVRAIPPSTVQQFNISTPSLPREIQHRLYTELKLFKTFAKKRPAVTPTVAETNRYNTLVQSLGNQSFSMNWFGVIDPPTKRSETKIPSRFAVLEADVKSRLAGSAYKFQTQLATLRQRLVTEQYRSKQTS